MAFAGTPDVHTTAHEAAHVVQQRAGVALQGGVGQAGDRYEQHADAVADAVVQGKSAEPILDRMAGGPSSAGSVQGRSIQRDGGMTENDKLALANQIRDQIPYASDAYMKACRDEPAKIEKAAKQKAEIAGVVLDVVTTLIPPGFGAVAKNALLGVSTKLEGAALEAAVEAAHDQDQDQDRDQATHVRA